MSDDARSAAVVLIARCENRREPDWQPCPGRLRYRWGQSDAACDTCGGRCGIAVAAWVEVQPGAEEALARVEALAEELANPGLHAGLNNVAARIRAAIAAPLAGQRTTDEEGR